MAHEWKKDPGTGDDVLIVDGKERGRIPQPDQKKFDQGKPGGSIIGHDDLKKELERLAGCGDKT